MARDSRETFDDLNKVSPSFCIAKWLQTTMLLQNGQTHSCHHTPLIKVDPQNLLGNPSGLHNTPEQQEDRADMLDGERPPGCDYCWKAEDLPGDHLPDRAHKSAASWAWPNLQRVMRSGDSQPINPTYLEVSFSNVCNFKCAYCSPDISSKWMEEVKQHGGYPVSRSSRGLDVLEMNDRMPIPHRDPNPYVDAFWKWWPVLYQSLHTFRITGGEPLLDKNTWRVLDDIRANPRADLTLGLNSNMNVPDDLQEKLIDYALDLEQKVGEFQIFTSAEAHGEACEYIRFGMIYRQWFRNVVDFMDRTEKATMTFMIAFNLMSVTTFDEFLDDFLYFRRKYGKRVRLSTNYVRHPPYLDCRVLSPDLKQRYSGIISGMFRDFPEFTVNERRDGLRLAEYMLQEPDDRPRDEQDFARFIREHDRRRGMDFDAVFPELSGFLKQCEER